MSDAIRERIKEFEEELTKTKYNKKTQHHIGLVKAKIAALKEKIEQHKKGKGVTDGYTIKKSGDATVAMLGFPSVGKSTLLNRLTNAKSPVAAYEFTTLELIPGLLDYKGAKIQIFDVPGIVGGAADGTGRGKEVLAAIRSADLIMEILDVNQLHHHEIIQREVYDSGIRLNKRKPDVRIRRHHKGGIQVSSTVPLDMTHETIAEILKEFRIINASVLIRTQIGPDELIDCIEQNKKYAPGITVLNKIDTLTPEQLSDLKKIYPNAVYISAEREENLDELKERIFADLKLVKLFLKEPGKTADLDEPLILAGKPTIKAVCEKLHREFVTKFKYARIWGKSAKYDGQKITKLTHVLSDSDIIELNLR